MRKPLRSFLAVLAVILLSGCTMTQSRQATEKDAPIRKEDVKVLEDNATKLAAALK